MHEAAGKGYLDILQYLVEKGCADLVHATNFMRMTPLHKACREGRLACVKLLMSIGADPEAKDLRGDT